MLDNAVTRHEKWLADRARDEAEVARLRAGESANAATDFEHRARDQEILAEERGRLLAEREKTIEGSQARIAELERALGREEGRREELERPRSKIEDGEKSSR